MTIALPVDAETDRLARRLAEATGRPLPTVVREAIAAEAARVGVSIPPRVPPSDLRERMIEITNGFADLPILDSRPADEIIGYDEHGVPS